MSVTMFDHMLTSYSLKGEFDKYGLTEQDITFIKEQIDPKNNKKVEHTKNTENTVTPAHAITSIKRSPFLVLKIKISFTISFLVLPVMKNV
jgi:hypothetical protein